MFSHLHVRVRACVRVCRYVCDGIHVKIREQRVESVVSFHHVGVDINCQAVWQGPFFTAPSCRLILSKKRLVQVDCWLVDAMSDLKPAKLRADQRLIPNLSPSSVCDSRLVHPSTIISYLANPKPQSTTGLLL